MSLQVDAIKGKEAAKLLFQAFRTTGIHGQTGMPEDVMPAGMVRGSLEHTAFITLTVSIDYQRDAPALWASSRKTFEDPETRYLFDFRALHLTPPSKIERDMQKYGVSKKPQKDAHIWRTVGVTFFKKWHGDPKEFLAAFGWDSPTILERLKQETHLEGGGPAPDFPYLRGNKIGPLWIRMLRDNVGIHELRRLDYVPIPVDIHVARASLALGVVRGKYHGSLEEVFARIRTAWFRSVSGLELEGQELIALDVDEPLWHLSKYGCTHRDPVTGRCPLARSCEAGMLCIPGQVRVDATAVGLDT